MGDHPFGGFSYMDSRRPGRVFGSGGSAMPQFVPPQQGMVPGNPASSPMMHTMLPTTGYSPISQGLQGGGMHKPRDTSSLALGRNPGALEGSNKNSMLQAVALHGAQAIRALHVAQQCAAAQLGLAPALGGSPLVHAGSPVWATGESAGMSAGGGSPAGHRGPLAGESGQGFRGGLLHRFGLDGPQRGRDEGDALHHQEPGEPLRMASSPGGGSGSRESSSDAGRKAAEQEEAPRADVNQSAGGHRGVAGAGGAATSRVVGKRGRGSRVDPCLRDGPSPGKKPKKVDPCLADGFSRHEKLPPKRPTKLKEIEDASPTGHEDIVDLCEAIEDLSDRLPYAAMTEKDKGVWQRWLGRVRSCSSVRRLAAELEWFGRQIDVSVLLGPWQKDQRAGWILRCKGCTNRDILGILLEDLEANIDGEVTERLFGKEKLQELQLARMAKREEKGPERRGRAPKASTGVPGRRQEPSTKPARSQQREPAARSSRDKAAAKPVRAPRRPSAKSKDSLRAALTFSQQEEEVASLLVQLSNKGTPSKTGALEEAETTEDEFEVEASSTPMPSDPLALRKVLGMAAEEEEQPDAASEREEKSDEEQHAGSAAGPARKGTRKDSFPEPSLEVELKAPRNGRGEPAALSAGSGAADVPARSRLVSAVQDDASELADGPRTEDGSKAMEQVGVDAEKDCEAKGAGGSSARQHEEQGDGDAGSEGHAQGRRASYARQQASAGEQGAGDAESEAESEGKVQARRASCARQQAAAGEGPATGGHSQGGPAPDPGCEAAVPAVPDPGCEAAVPAVPDPGCEAAVPAVPDPGCEDAVPAVPASDLHMADAVAEESCKVAGGHGGVHSSSAGRAHAQGVGRNGGKKAVGIMECRKMVIKLSKSLPYDAMTDPNHETWKTFILNVQSCKNHRDLAKLVEYLCDLMRPEVFEEQQKKGWVTRLRSCESLAELRGLIAGLRKSIDFAAATNLVIESITKEEEGALAELAVAPKRLTTQPASSAAAKKRKLHGAAGDGQGEGVGGQEQDAVAEGGAGLGAPRIGDVQVKEDVGKPSKKVLEMCRKNLVKFSEKLPYAAMTDENHGTWSEFTRSVKRCGTAAELAERLQFLASQVKPRVLARGWIRQHRDAWLASLQRCASLTAFQEALLHFRRVGVDMSAAMSTVGTHDQEEEALTARLLENKVLEPEWGKGDKDYLLSQWKDWSKEIRLTAEEVGVSEVEVEHVWAHGSLPPKGTPRVVRRQAPMRPFKCIKKNLYRTQKPRPDDSEEAQVCRCAKEEGKCCEDDECLNRAIFVECDSALCPLGDKCCNQRLRRQQYPKSKVAYTQERGHGLFAEEDIKQGQLVHEYIGEVIHRDTWKQRLASYDDETPVYFFALGSLFIDASEYGSLARFMNHSCNPNCFAQKWSVDQEDRVGIFAKQDIKKGDELMYNYGFEVHGVRHRCCCGSANCTGYLGKDGNPRTAKV